MSEVVIQAENIYKEYRLGTIGYGTLRQDFQSWWARLLGKDDPNTTMLAANTASTANNNEIFLALQDVSFNIERGEVVGIIGKNGAGKSTLLKIISRVTAPTKGSIKIKGRVASLLEVGTGFHPELTGRENVYLNGTILGMTKREIDRKFDEIVAFAEVEKFIDTPVKRYSSGMYVRLAFAVAAHLEPEILIVDEVLAVGDAEFQKKCLGKMKDVGNEGRTVLFVSHNMAAIRQLCSRGLLIDGGRLKKYGLVDEVMELYLNSQVYLSEGEYTWDDKNAPGDDNARINAIRLRSHKGEKRLQFGTSESIFVEVEYTLLRNLDSFRVGYAVHSSDGVYIFYTSDIDSLGVANEVRKAGKYISRCEIPANWLNIGSYSISVSGGIYGVKEVFTGLPKFKITIFSTGGPSSVFSEQRKGVFAPLLSWEIANFKE